MVMMNDCARVRARFDRDSSPSTMIIGSEPIKSAGSSLMALSNLLDGYWSRSSVAAAAASSARWQRVISEGHFSEQISCLIRNKGVTLRWEIEIYERTSRVVGWLFERPTEWDWSAGRMSWSRKGNVYGDGLLIWELWRTFFRCFSGAMLNELEKLDWSNSF